MLDTYLTHSTILDWIIGLGFTLVVGGVTTFRCLAIWLGWFAD